MVCQKSFIKFRDILIKVHDADKKADTDSDSSDSDSSDSDSSKDTIIPPIPLTPVAPALVAPALVAPVPDVDDDDDVNVAL